MDSELGSFVTHHFSLLISMQEKYFFNIAATCLVLKQIQSVLFPEARIFLKYLLLIPENIHCKSIKPCPQANI